MGKCGGGEEERKFEARKQKLTLTCFFFKVHAPQNEQGGFASAAAPKRALAAQEFALHPDPLCFRYL